MPAYSRKETPRLGRRHEVHSPLQAQTSKNPPESDIFLAAQGRREPGPDGRWNSTACVERREKSSTSRATFQSAAVTFQFGWHPTKPPGGPPACACDCPNAANRESKRSRCELRAASWADGSKPTSR